MIFFYIPFIFQLKVRIPNYEPCGKIRRQNALIFSQKFDCIKPLGTGYNLIMKQ